MYQFEGKISTKSFRDSFRLYSEDNLGKENTILILDEGIFLKGILGDEVEIISRIVFDEWKLEKIVNFKINIREVVEALKHKRGKIEIKIGSDNFMLLSENGEIYRKKINKKIEKEIRVNKKRSACKDKSEEEKQIEMQIKIKMEELQKVIGENDELKRENKILSNELVKMRKPPLQVGVIIEELNDGLILSLNKAEYKIWKMKGVHEGDTVAINQRNMTIHEVLPSSRNRAKKFIIEEKPKISFEDIGGLKMEIMEVKEVIEMPFLHPERFVKVGITPPKGCLLYGPPGNGKTMIAKAVANSCNATFLAIVGSEFVLKYIGTGAQVIKDVFNLAKDNIPAIIFIDEIDAFAGRRIDTEISGDREIARTLNQFLAEFDGFNNIDGIYVIGATNRIELLDDAILRSGRLGKKIYIPNPDKKARFEIFKVCLRRVNSKGVEIKSLVEVTKGFSGAEIQCIIKEAGIRAIKNNRTYITQCDMEIGIEKVKNRMESHEGIPYII